MVLSQLRDAGPPALYRGTGGANRVELVVFAFRRRSVRSGRSTSRTSMPASVNARVFVPQTRREGLSDVGAQHPAPAPPGPGTAPRRSQLDTVPSRPGGRRPGLRRSDRGDGRPGRRHRPPHRRLGHPGRPEPADGSRPARRPVRHADPRPGREVRSRLRRGRHVAKVLATYVTHYNTARPHRGIDLDIPAAEGTPTPASVKQIRRIERVDLLGGLVHEYRHAA